MRTVLTTALSLLLLWSPAATAAADADDGVRTEAATIAGDDASIWYPVHRDRRLPVALFLPGANVDRANYSEFATAVARFGFVVVVPDHYILPGYRLPSEHALGATLGWARETVTRGDSALASILDPGRLVVAGHSYGAATALYAAADRCQIPFCFGPPLPHPAELVAVAGFGLNTTIGPIIDQVAVAGIPVMYVNGSADGISEPDEALASYDKLTGAPSAMFVTVLGANHFGITDIDNPAGATPDPRAQTVPRERTVATVAHWIACWFLAQLGDAEVAHTLTVSDPAVEVRVR
ncbi:alpha/beta hydrolase family protein [Nocardia alba]|uniref:Chlorophyllase-like protein n=1 Tax=Nocardia alba TaxID=225051 RepID=A0A4R1FU06_9NOCA|nr:alpha/beta hydrolase [Nocardia alba]TCJ97109.1 chlorophyllase-like protein [Nocardia alba]